MCSMLASKRFRPWDVRESLSISFCWVVDTIWGVLIEASSRVLRSRRFRSTNFAVKILRNHNKRIGKKRQISFAHRRAGRVGYSCYREVCVALESVSQGELNELAARVCTLKVRLRSEQPDLSVSGDISVCHDRGESVIVTCGIEKDCIDEHKIRGFALLQDLRWPYVSRD